MAKQFTTIGLSATTERLLNHKDTTFTNVLNDGLKQNIIGQLKADEELSQAINALDLDLTVTKDKTLTEVITEIKDKVDTKYLSVFGDYLSNTGKGDSPIVSDVLGLSERVTDNPILADTMLKYNAKKLGSILKVNNLGIDNELPLLLNTSNDQKAFLLSQWQVEKQWDKAEVSKIQNALGLMRVAGSQSDIVSTFWGEGIQKVSDLATHNVDSLSEIIKKGKVGATDATDNTAFAEAVLLQAEQEHPAAFFMHRVAEKPEWLGLEATDRPSVSEGFKQFYNQNKDFDLKTEPIISLETGLLNEKINGVAAVPKLIKELSAAQQALQLSPDTNIAALLLNKNINIATANTSTHKTLMRELDIDAATAVQIKEKAQYYHDTTMNGFLAYRDLISNPFLKNVLGNLNPVKEAILDGIGKNDNWEAIKQSNGLRGLDSIEDLFGSQNYCECDSCQSVLSPSAYFVDLMSFVEGRVLQQTTSLANGVGTVTGAILDATHPIHLKVRRPDLWTLKLNCENTNKRIPYIEIINEVLTAFVEKHLGSSKTIAERLSEEQPRLEFLLPYQKSLDEVRTWLSFFGLQRLQVLEYLYSNPTEAEKLSIAIESLNLSEESYNLIVNNALTANIDSDVLEFRRKSGLSAEETEQLVALKFWGGSLAIKQVKDSSDIQKFSLEFESTLSNWQGQMHRLLRLWKATGWTLAEFDSISQTFGLVKDNLDETAMRNLAAFKKTQSLLALDTETLVTILNGVPIAKTPNSKISWEQLLPKTWITGVAVKLDDLRANTDDGAIKLLLDLQGIFGVNSTDILACLDFLKDKIGDVQTPLAITFDVSVLNTIFRYVQLYKWSKTASFEAFAQILKVWGQGTVKFLDVPVQNITSLASYLQSFRQLTFSTDDLLYLFGEELTTTTIIEEDKTALQNTELKTFIKTLADDQYLQFLNKWLGIETEVLGYYQHFLEETDAKLQELLNDLKKDTPTDATYIAASNLKKRLDRLAFLFNKYKIDLDTQKIIAKVDCEYLKLGFTTWGAQNWVKEIAYLGSWIAETRNLRSFDLFKILRAVEKEATLDTKTQKALAKWQSLTLTQVQNVVQQTASITTLQTVWERLAWAKKLNINSELLDKLKVDVALSVQSSILQNAIRSKFEDNESWEASIQEYKNKLSSNLRDALCNFVIFNQDLLALNFGFKDRESLYQYFLLDVSMGDCFTLPRIVAATNSLQVYIHRCIMGLERSADEKVSVLLDIDEIQEWEWRKNYRVWEANRKIFLFPENYVEPEIRDNKSPEFKELEDELLQQKLNMEVVENAYKKYLQQVMVLAELRMAGAYFDKVYNRIYLFGKTNKQPVEFYYRYVEFLESGGLIWSNWEKMNISIPAEDISAIRHNGKLHIFWTTFQRKDISSVKGGNSEISQHTYDVFANYSYLKVDKKWSPPQRVDMGYRTNSPFDPFLRVGTGASDYVQNANTSTPTLKEGADDIRENVLKEFEHRVYRKPYPVWAYDQKYLNLDYIWTDKKDALTPRYKHTRAVIDAFRISVRVVVRYEFFGITLNTEQDVEFSFDRLDSIVRTASSTNEQQAPVSINIAPMTAPFSVGGETLNFTYIFNKNSSGKYTYSLQTTNSLGNKKIFFKDINREVKSGDVDVIHQIDYVPISTIEYKTETVDMARQKRVAGGFQFRGGSTINPGFSLASSGGIRFGLNAEELPGIIKVKKGTTQTISRFSGLLGIRESIGYTPGFIGIFPPSNPLASEYNTYYDNFSNFFVTDGTADFADGYNDYKIQQRDMVAILTTPTNADPNKGYKLNPEQIQMLWDKISVSIDDLLDTQTQRHVVGQIDYSQSFGNYFYELFFHIPMRIADHLNSAGKYREANHWYSYIYNPTAIKDKFEQLVFPHDVNWRFAAFRNIGIQKLKDIYSDQNAITMYQRNPGNPHAIARLRVGAYQKNVVMKYLDNLMDWGDYLFEQYTPESTSEARHLYSIVKTILGNKPEKTGKCQEEKPDLTYETVGSGNSGDFIYALFAAQTPPPAEKQELNIPVKISNTVSVPLMAKLSNDLSRPAKYSSKMMLFVGEKLETSITAVSPGRKFGAGIINKGNDFTIPMKPLPYFRPIQDLSFCFPHNKDFIKYWDRVDDRIYKLNHCLDINGVKKLMPAFAPEIDPALLARMVAGGLSFDEIAAALNADLPNHRFIYLIEKAKQYCGIVQGFGQALFAAIEKKDSEELVLLRSRHEQNILTLTIRNKQRQIEQAKTNLQVLLENKKNIENRKTHFSGLIEEGLITWETVQQVSRHVGTGLKLAESVVHLMAGITYLIPQVGSPFAMKYGGQELGHSGVEFAQWTSSMAGIADAVSASAGLEAGNQRREQEWQFQLKTATQELVSIGQQIRNAEISVTLAELDLELHNTNIEQYKELHEFYTTKFTDYKHYTFQVRQLQQLYRMAFNLAQDLASQAQQAFDFERYGVEVNTGFIKNDNWNNDKLGLLAGERLMLQLMQMEKEFIDTDKRKKEITQHFSMLQLAPDKLLALKMTGESADFTIPEAAFDLTYPGYYRRIIKSVRVSIPCIAGPYTNIGATLSLGTNKIRAAKDGTLDDFIFGGCETIATSNAQNDGGQFELNFRDERYLPFEGAGAVSSWTLSLPKIVRAFDYNTISDVIFHINYTAEYDGVFKDSVESSLANELNAINGQGLTRVFSMRHDFPTDWHKLTTHGNVTDAVLELRREHFPYFAHVADIKGIKTNGVFTLSKDNELAATNTAITKSAKMQITVPVSAGQQDLKDVLFIVEYTVNG